MNTIKGGKAVVFHDAHGSTSKVPDRESITSPCDGVGKPIELNSSTIIEQQMLVVPGQLGAKDVEVSMGEAQKHASVRFERADGDLKNFVDRHDHLRHMIHAASNLVHGKDGGLDGALTVRSSPASLMTGCFSHASNDELIAQSTQETLQLTVLKELICASSVVARDLGSIAEKFIESVYYAMAEELPEKDQLAQDMQIKTPLKRSFFEVASQMRSERAAMSTKEVLKRAAMDLLNARGTSISLTNLTKDVETDFASLKSKVVEGSAVDIPAIIGTLADLVPGAHLIEATLCEASILLYDTGEELKKTIAGL
jgi:hypothetical protein